MTGKQPTRDELAKNLMRARWLLKQVGVTDEQSLWLVFMDNTLSRYYGNDQFETYLDSELPRSGGLGE